MLTKTYISQRSGKKWEKFEKKVSVSGKKIPAQKPIPKLDLGFSSRYRNWILVSHYLLVVTAHKSNQLKENLLHTWLNTIRPLDWLLPQTREQTLGGTFLWYEKSILGCWLWVGLGCGIKGLGRLWATFEGGFFNFLWAKKKKKFENIAASALKSFFGNNFLFQKNQLFLGLKIPQ
jgi:hypothetical protein